MKAPDIGTKEIIANCFMLNIIGLTSLTESTNLLFPLEKLGDILNNACVILWKCNNISYNYFSHVLTTHPSLGLRIITMNSNKFGLWKYKLGNSDKSY